MLGHAACVAMSTPRINTNATRSTTLTEVREENIMRQNAKFFALFLLVAMGAASRCAQATNLTVNCDRHESLHKVLRLLATTNPQGPNKVTVLGDCKGNFVIQSMDRLTLITNKGASITDRSNGSLAVVDIEDSHRVTVQGFTINGGAQGILCNTGSVCYLTGNTIQGPGSFPGRFGVIVVRGSLAFLESNVIQNWARGAFITGAQVFSSNDVFQGNGGSGIAVLVGAYFESVNSSFNNNGDGIEAGGSRLTLVGGTISDNGGIGIRMLGSASVAFEGPTVTGNGGVGVHLEDGAFAGFLAANITGNLSGLDIDCEPQFPITRFIDRTGGITNCVEPASDSKLKAVE
jgi:Right handed beta helix region